MDSILSLYSQFQELTKTNQVVAGAVSLWGLGVITYLVRNVPSKIWSFLSNQATTAFTVSNSGTGGNQIRYNLVLNYVLKQKGSRFSRSLSLRTTDLWDGDIRKSEQEVQPGYGTHFFISEGRLYWYTRLKEESSATTHQKETLSITTFGRSHKPFYRFIEESLPFKEDDTLSHFKYTDRSWCLVSSLVKRDLRTVITTGGVKEDILANIEEFTKSEQWYKERGLNWKEVFVLHGPPGTGKTSLLKAIASHLNFRVYEMNLANMTDDSFSSALGSIGKNSICIIEDFDTVSSTGIRTPARRAPQEQDEYRVGDHDSSLYSLLSLTTILNTLDGITSLNGVIIFMTTNHIDKIDPAILRKGRTDHIYELKYFTDKEVREYASLMYPGIDIPDGIRFSDVAGCDVYAAFKENKYDSDGFIKTLLSKDKLSLAA